MTLEKLQQKLVDPPRDVAPVERTSRVCIGLALIFSPACLAPRSLPWWLLDTGLTSAGVDRRKTAAHLHEDGMGDFHKEISTPPA